MKNDFTNVINNNTNIIDINTTENSESKKPNIVTKATLNHIKIHELEGALESEDINEEISILGI